MDRQHLRRHLIKVCAPDRARPAARLRARVRSCPCRLWHSDTHSPLAPCAPVCHRSRLARRRQGEMSRAGQEGHSQRHHCQRACGPRRTEAARRPACTGQPGTQDAHARMGCACEQCDVTTPAAVRWRRAGTGIYLGAPQLGARERVALKGGVSCGHACVPRSASHVSRITSGGIGRTCGMWIETFPRYAHVVLSPYTPPEASGAIRDMRGGRGNIWCMRAPDTCRFAKISNIF